MRLNVDLESGLGDLYVCVDQHRFTQAIRSLLSNAVNATTAGSNILIAVKLHHYYNDNNNVSNSSKKGSGIGTGIGTGTPISTNNTANNNTLSNSNMNNNSNHNMSMDTHNRRQLRRGGSKLIPFSDSIGVRIDVIDHGVGVPQV